MSIMAETVLPLLRDWKLMNSFGNGTTDCIQKFSFVTKAMGKNGLMGYVDAASSNAGERVMTSQSDSQNAVIMTSQSDSQDAVIMTSQSDSQETSRIVIPPQFAKFAKVVKKERKGNDIELACPEYISNGKPKNTSKIDMCIDLLCR
jgi:hypothetical protein